MTSLMLNTVIKICFKFENTNIRLCTTTIGINYYGTKFSNVTPDVDYIGYTLGSDEIAYRSLMHRLYQ